MRLLYLVITVFLLVVFNSFADNTREIQQLAKKNNGIKFLSNRGQLISNDGSPAEDVLFTANYDGKQIYVRKTGLSFVYLKVEAGDGLQATGASASSAASATGKKVVELVETTDTENVAITRYRMDMELVEQNEDVEVKGLEKLKAYNNYYLAHCQVTHVPIYSKVKYENVYDDIDMVLYTRDDNQLEYDFVVKPGADPSAIQFRFEHTDGVEISTDGSMLVKNPFGGIEKLKPYTYQEGINGRTEIPSSFNIDEEGVISFNLGEYNPSKPLVIDPIVRIWGTYYGGASHDRFRHLAIDDENNIYACGKTLSSNTDNLIASKGAFQTTYSGNEKYDVVLAKFDKDGNRLWSTYYGGKDHELPYKIGTVSDGVIIVGSTASNEEDNVIASSNGHQTFYGGGEIDGFIVKFDKNGYRLWGSYYGGEDQDEFRSFVITPDSTIFVGGSTLSSNNGQLIATKGAPQVKKGDNYDCMLVKFNQNGERFWSTYLGNQASEKLYDMAFDSDTSIYLYGLMGEANSKLITSGSFKDTLTGISGVDCFLTKLNTNAEILWGTYYGTTLWDNTLVGHDADIIGSVVVDIQDNIYICGSALDGSYFTALSTPDGHQPRYSGGIYTDGFLAKFNKEGNRIWGTYYGSSAWHDAMTYIAIDKNLNIYVSGFATDDNSTEVISTKGCYQYKAGDVYADAFLVKFNSDGKRLWGTYYGGADEDYGYGIVLDSSNNLYMCGATYSNTPAGSFSTLGSHQLNNAGGKEGFIVRFQDSVLTTGQIQEQLCSGDIINISFKAHEEIDSNNVFTAQISDEYGNFNNPMDIGSLVSEESGEGVIEATIPEGIKSGTKYRIRVVSSAPRVLGTDNEHDIAIYSLNPEISGKDTVCLGSEEVFSVESIEGTANEWSVSSGSIVGGNIGNEVNIDFTTPGSCTISLNQSVPTAGCEAGTYKVVTVLPLPEVTLTAFDAACDDYEAFQLTGCSPEGGTYSGDGVNDGSFSPVEAGSGTHTITYTYTDENGCTNSAEQDITVYATPPQPVITRIGSVLESSADEGNQWYFDSEKISGATDKQYEPDQEGVYTVQVTEEHGCESDMSEGFDFTSGIDDLTKKSDIRIYPNPADELIIIDFSVSPETHISIGINDMLGVEHYHAKAISGSNFFRALIETDKFPAGAYTCVITIGNREYKRVVSIVR